VRAFGFAPDGPGAGLYSGGADSCVRVWDLAAGSCAQSVPVGGDVGSLLLAGGWLFVGLPSKIACWHLAGGAGLEPHSLDGHNGAVQALACQLEKSLLFSGGQDLSVRCWAFDAATSRFAACGVLTGHTGGVTALLVAGSRLLSASLDGTVRGWELEAGGAAAFVAHAHVGGCMSMLLWEGHLVSAGLDGKVRVWAGAGGGQALEPVFTHPDGEAGPASPSNVFLPPSPPGRGGGGADGRALAMCGSMNAAGEPVLVVSFDDCTLRFLSLPAFEDRGRLRQQSLVRALASSATGFVAGDDRGLIRSWGWARGGGA